VLFASLLSLQALRVAFDRAFDSCFEQVLQEAEAADHSSSSSAKSGSGSWGSVTHGKGSSGSVQQAAGGTPGASGTCTALLRRPAVFTLGMVWESPKVRAAAAHIQPRAVLAD
jgi:hypothetical protein